MLDATDRCDSCRAQAYVEITVYGTPMLWCGHHWNAYKAKLIPVATQLRDFTFLLDVPMRAQVEA